MTDTPKLPAHITLATWHVHFDADIRDHARKIAYHLPEFRRLIIQAKAEELHKLLGFKSWPAYVADVIGKEMTRLPVDDRRQIIGVLLGEGMSQRAMADAVGVSQSTVRDDVAEVSRNYSPASGAKMITGTDGKLYPNKAAKIAADVDALIATLMELCRAARAVAKHPLSAEQLKIVHGSKLDAIDALDELERFLRTPTN